MTFYHQPSFPLPQPMHRGCARPSTEITSLAKKIINAKKQGPPFPSFNSSNSFINNLQLRPPFLLPHPFYFCSTTSLFSVPSTNTVNLHRSPISSFAKSACLSSFPEQQPPVSHSGSAIPAKSPKERQEPKPIGSSLGGEILFLSHIPCGEE